MWLGTPRGANRDRARCGDVGHDHDGYNQWRKIAHFRAQIQRVAENRTSQVPKRPQNVLITATHFKMFEKPPLISRSRVGPCPVCRLRDDDWPRDDGRDCCPALPLDSTVQGHCSSELPPTSPPRSPASAACVTTSCPSPSARSSGSKLLLFWANCIDKGGPAQTCAGPPFVLLFG